jgi:uncharacterized membrane protein
VQRLAAGVVLLAALTLAPAAGAQDPAVRAVLFFSPTCGHCEYVINDFLLPVWFPQYGGEPEWSSAGVEGEDAAFFLASNGTLEILLVDRDAPAGRDFYDAVGVALAIPPERTGVPRLVVGDSYLVGSREIPEQFPGIIEEGLAGGGIDWPDLPGMQEILAALAAEPATTTTSAPTSTTVPETTTVPAGSTTTVPAGSTTTSPAESTTTSPPETTTTAAALTTTTTLDESPLFGGDSPWERFRRDAVANSLAVAVLVLMVASLLGVAWLARRGDEAAPPGFAVPLLALVGLAVAAYLAFVETNGSTAVCGPVGDCNAVQQSEWARVFGIHIGVIGVAGYALVLFVWAAARFGSSGLSEWARVALFIGGVAGTGFSIYLTFLEPFVIGATCLWCLSSAVVVTLLMWLTARPAAAAWGRLRAGD